MTALLAGTKKYLKPEYLIFIAIIAFPLFYNLGAKPIELWDESRNAVNAIEMFDGGNHIVRYFKNSPDMWEVKPPLLIWMQQICFKVFGISEFSIRFPSAFLTLLLILFIFLFLKKELNLKIAGYISGLVLISSQGYINTHIARTGDHDASLVFFVYMYMFSFYKYFTSDTGKGKYFLLGTLFLILSTYTKSIVSIMFLPGILIFALYKRRFIQTLKDPFFYIGISLYLILVASYYLYRESINPGYLYSVWNEELFPRYMKESKSIWFYISNFSTSRFIPWIYFLIPAVIYNLYKAKGRIKDFLLLHLFSSGIFLFVISMGDKNVWYDALLYPTFSIHIGIAGYYLYTDIKNRKNKKLQFLTISIFILSFLIPYISITSRIYSFTSKPVNTELHGISYYIKDQIEQNKFQNDYVFVYDKYDAHIYFYARLYKLQSGNAVIQKNPDKISDNKLYVACQNSIISEI